MLYLVIFHLVPLALLLLFRCSICLLYLRCFFLAISFLTVLVRFSFLFLTLWCSLYRFLFLAMSLFLVLVLLVFLFFFLALSCCCCTTSSFVTVPVSALATEEYPTVKSAIAQIGNSFFSFHFSPSIRFTSLRIGCITRINKRYKYKMQMKYISFKDFIKRLSEIIFG